MNSIRRQVCGVNICNAARHLANNSNMLRHLSERLYSCRSATSPWHISNPFDGFVKSLKVFGHREILRHQLLVFFLNQLLFLHRIKLFLNLPDLFTRQGSFSLLELLRLLNNQGFHCQLFAFHWNPNLRATHVHITATLSVPLIALTQRFDLFLFHFDFVVLALRKTDAIIIHH